MFGSAYFGAAYFGPTYWGRLLAILGPFIPTLRRRRR
jgi:hypothetical protein